MLYFLEVQYNSAREFDRFDWVDSGEGPFDSAVEAVRFALAECGLPWRVVDEDYEPNQIEYASGNEDRPPADPPACPICKTNNSEHGDDAWWCRDCGMEFMRGRATITSGPAPAISGRFVVQRHQARTLHYDFRLEKDGVFKSWAVPKGLPEEPGVTRGALAAQDNGPAFAIKSELHSNDQCSYYRPL